MFITKYISEYSFVGCTLHEVLYFSNSLKIIGSCAFKNSQLCGIKFSKICSLREIKDSAFDSSIIDGNFKFQDNLIKIEPYAFYNSILRIVSFQSTKRPQVIGFYSFENSAISANLKFRSTLQVITFGALENCTNLWNLTIDQSVYSIFAIEGNAFRNSSIYGKLVISFYVNEIGTKVFENFHN